MTAPRSLPVLAKELRLLADLRAAQLGGGAMRDRQADAIAELAEWLGERLATGDEGPTTKPALGLEGEDDTWSVATNGDIVGYWLCATLFLALCAGGLAIIIKVI